MVTGETEKRDYLLRLSQSSLKSWLKGRAKRRRDKFSLSSLPKSRPNLGGFWFLKDGKIKKMEKYGWKTLGEKLAYQNPFMRVVEYDVIRPNGTRAPYYVLDRGGPFSIIIPLTATYQTYLVGQFRYATQFYSWEFPMGFISGLTPLQIAKQELKEETGLTAKKWQKIGRFYVASGHTNQEAFVFLAQKLTQGEPKPEENEFLQVKKLSIERVGEWIKKGKIRDDPSITAYHLFKANFQFSNPNFQ